MNINRVSQLNFVHFQLTTIQDGFNFNIHKDFSSDLQNGGSVESVILSENRPCVEILQNGALWTIKPIPQSIEQELIDGSLFTPSMFGYQLGEQLLNNGTISAVDKESSRRSRFWKISTTDRNNNVNGLFEIDPVNGMAAQRSLFSLRNGWMLVQINSYHFSEISPGYYVPNQAVVLVKANRNTREFPSDFFNGSADSPNDRMYLIQLNAIELNPEITVDTFPQLVPNGVTVWDYRPFVTGDARRGMIPEGFVLNNIRNRIDRVEGVSSNGYDLNN